MKRLLSITITVVWSLFAITAWAEQSPVQVVKDTVVHLQQEVQKQHADLKNSPQKLYRVVNKVIMPQVAINEMAALVLGPKWRTANQQQRNEFVKQFAMLMTRTYANALLTVADYDVSVSPLRNQNWQKAKQIAVMGTVKPRNGGPSSQIIYYLVNEQSGWKIYDFSIEGVSFVQNYRSQFASFQKIQPLIERLSTLNKQRGMQ